MVRSVKVEDLKPIYWPIDAATSRLKGISLVHQPKQSTQVGAWQLS
jgi:hypothetical protein